MKFTWKALGTAVVCLALFGCGDSSNSGVVSDSYVFPAGKATLAFSAVSTAQLPAAISAIDFTIALPQGMDVTTSGGAAQIESASVTPGAALAGTNLAFGSYSASTGKAHLSMVTTNDTYRRGEFLRLSCNVAANTSITLGALKALNDPVTLKKATGYDQATQSTVIFTDKVKVTLTKAQ